MRREENLVEEEVQEEEEMLMAECGTSRSAKSKDEVEVTILVSKRNN